MKITRAAARRHCRICLVVSLVMFVWVSAPLQAQDDGSQPLSPPEEEPVSSPLSHREQRDNYLWGTFGPPELIGDALSSAFQQWRDTPYEWGRGTGGYAKRYVAGYAESAIGDTTQYLIARALDEDPSFWPCACTGVLQRLRHASAAPFRARKPDGRSVFSTARVAGLTVGEAVAEIWYPPPRGFRSTVKNAAVDVAGQIGVDLLREFVFHRRTVSRSSEP